MCDIIKLLLTELFHLDYVLFTGCSGWITLMPRWFLGQHKVPIQISHSGSNDNRSSVSAVLSWAYTSIAVRSHQLLLDTIQQILKLKLSMWWDQSQEVYRELSAVTSAKEKWVRTGVPVHSICSFRFFTKPGLHIRNMWRLLEVLTPQRHPRPAESEYLGVSLTVEWRLGTRYHLKQEDNIACFSEIDTSHVQSVAGVVWVEAMQALSTVSQGIKTWTSQLMNSWNESANEFMDLFVAVLTKGQNLGLTLVCTFDTYCWQGLSRSWSFWGAALPQIWIKSQCPQSPWSFFDCWTVSVIPHFQAE